MLIGEKLKERRIRKDLTLKEVANELGVSTTYVRSVENNRIRHPSLTALRKLAKIYEVPTSYFIDDDENTKFKVIFRDLQEDLVILNDEDRKIIELMVKALKVRYVHVL